MKKRSAILLILLFLILIPIIIVIYSYIPVNMIKLSTDSEWEYFHANVLCNLSLKLLVSVIISGIITGGIGYLIYQKRNY